ncbi:D-2-hydroxyacid dehydrogenase [Halarchaeum nitratireducens]|nr:D-2-hydroxyacid dehydrogenase [Halarchaeum nitratireducens]
MSDVLVLREGTEGLSMADYADELRERLPDHDIGHARTPHEERDLAADADVITGITVDDGVLDAAGSFDLFACTFAGTDHVPVDDLVSRGVAVTNAGGIHAPGIAEQAIGHILTFDRRLHEAWRRKARREWRHFQSDELTDKTVTVVGLGAIGQCVVERLRGFGVDTVGVRYTPAKGGPTDEVIGFDERDFHAALARTDYLVLACPLTETTRGLIGEAELATLDPSAVIVNAARGGLVDTNALVSALQTEALRGVALDVTDPEPLPEDHVLWTLENALITPHTGGHTPKHWTRLADIVAENVRHLDRGGSVDDLTNLVRGSD